MGARRQDLTTSIGLLILRLGVGGFLASHGWGKVQMTLAGDFAKFGDPIGLGAGPSLVLVTIAEFLCSLLVMLGLGTRFAAVPVVIAMGVAAFVAHGGDPWTMGKGAELFMSGASKSWASKEPALLFLIPFLALIFTGAGRFSVDALIRRGRRTDTAYVAAGSG
ncbi:MAG TPA: DoxX family protein [Thermoanaerobaculia bacterium]|nr:DoxX family protein [Thermoanaerobaculia bacterium]